MESIRDSIKRFAKKMIGAKNVDQVTAIAAATKAVKFRG